MLAADSRKPHSVWQGQAYGIAKGGPPRAGGGPALDQSTCLHDPPYTKTHRGAKRFVRQRPFPSPRPSLGRPPGASLLRGTVSSACPAPAYLKPNPPLGQGRVQVWVSRAGGVRPLFTHLTKRRQHQLDSDDRRTLRKSNNKQLPGLLTNNAE